MKGAAIGALAFTVGGTQVLLTPSEARAQNVPFLNFDNPKRQEVNFRQIFNSAQAGEKSVAA